MRARQVILVNLIVFIVVIGVALAGVWYFYNRHNYLNVNDAQVKADMTYVVGMEPGKLTKWSLAEGSSVNSGDVIGQEQLPTGQTIDITAPASGQVLKNSAIIGEVIGQGTMLGAVADVSNEYITANVPETDIRDVHVGQTVDIYLDAYPGDSFSGQVVMVGQQSAAASSPLPTGSTTGSFTKQVQRIPVRISISGKEGKIIIPNMNAKIRIHK